MQIGMENFVQCSSVNPVLKWNSLKPYPASSCAYGYCERFISGRSFHKRHGEPNLWGEAVFMAGRLLFDPNPSANLVGLKKERMFAMFLKKSVLTGLLALGTIVGATAVSAAPYSVTGNDTMWTIAQKYGISLSSLVQANPQVTNANNIWPGMVLNIPGTSSSAPAPQGTGTPTTTSTFASQVVNLVNQERTKAGLKTLASDSALSAMALDKAKDMYNNHYFDHTSPTYGSPLT